MTLLPLRLHLHIIQALSIPLLSQLACVHQESEGILVDLHLLL